MAEVTADGFQLKIRAKNAGTTTVKVTASRSGQISKSTTFKGHCQRNSSGSEDKVIIRKISDQIMNRGSERIINVNTDGSSIKATSSNSSVARVSTRRDDTLVIEAVGTGTARITVTASRRGYRDATTSFYVDVNGKTISAPTVYMNYPNGASYTNGSWSNQNITFTLTGYSSGRTASPMSVRRAAAPPSGATAESLQTAPDHQRRGAEGLLLLHPRQRRRQRGHRSVYGKD